MKDPAATARPLDGSVAGGELYPESAPTGQLSRDYFAGCRTTTSERRVERPPADAPTLAEVVQAMTA